MPDVSDELESLRRENARLRKLLKLTDEETAAPTKDTQISWFDKEPGPVNAASSPQEKVAFYAALFGASRDVYALRWERTPATASPDGCPRSQVAGARAARQTNSDTSP